MTLDATKPAPETQAPESQAPETQARWARVTEIVDGALQRPDPRERRAFLKEACDGDGSLRREVENLLRFEDAEGGWLPESKDPQGQDPPSGATTEIQSHGEDGLGPGSRVGPYRIERQIGAGGMGRVFLAFEPSLQRHVALKVIRRDKVSEDLIRRFEQERRILARLEHPNIARIFGSGKHGGLPFFVMERVRGRPLDQWCDEHGLGVDERLELVVQVCEALDEAHRNLVVHRDLKPSNVWVDDEGRPKILDFGIAKDLAPADPSGPAGVQATTVHQPLSLPFAAPEQVRNRPVSVATDVYGLGVLVYELLCGHPPYVLDGDVFENVRTICEQVPEAPSRRATLNREIWRQGSPRTISPAESAERRSTEPRKLRRRLQGDLDAIVLKALAKEPAQRYRTMAELADDIRRHLDGRPVRAHGDGRLYRLRKLLRRRRVPIAVAVAGLWGLAGAWTSIDGERRAVRAEREALEADREAEAVTAFARNLVLAADPDASGRRLSASDMMKNAETEARRVLSDQPTSLAHQLEAMGLVLQSRGAYDEARPLLTEALELRQAAYDGDHRLVARSLNNLAALDHQSGDRASAETGYGEALAMKRRLGRPPEELGKVRGNLASLLVFRGAYDEAEPLLHDMLGALEGQIPINRAETAAVHRSLANLYYLSRRPDKAEPHARRALLLRQERFGPDSLKTASVLSLLGRIFQSQGRLDEAESSFRRVLDIRRLHLSPDHVHLALARKDLASLYFAMDEPALGQVLWRQAHDVLALRRPDGWEMDDLWRLWALQRPEAGACLDETRRRLAERRGSGSIFAAVDHPLP